MSDASDLSTREDVAPAPPPWDLAGQGIIVAVRLPQDVLDHGSFVPAGLRRTSRTRLAFAMFVDYTHSNVGPYHELLYIPGAYRFGAQSQLSITRIYVSSWASVVNGRRNWGIPKDQCAFDVRHDGARDHIALSTDEGHCFAELEFESFGPHLPAPAHWTPESWRTLAQERDGQRFTYTPSARGHFRFTRVKRWRFDPALFPDLARGQVLGAVKLTDFNMVFPQSRIEAL